MPNGMGQSERPLFEGDGDMKTIILATGFAVLLGIAPIATATLNSNSIVQYGIEYYVQTDKSIYELGENVEMLYRVTNLRDEDVTFHFGGSPVWNFWVEKNGENIWTAVESWYGVLVDFTLSPGESKEFPDGNPPYIWDMRDSEDNLINVGEYDVIGGLDGGAPEPDYDSMVSVPIIVVPEPSSLALLLGCIFYLTRKRRT
jgi:hypothetical protein